MQAEIQGEDEQGSGSGDVGEEMERMFYNADKTVTTTEHREHSKVHIEA